MQKLLHLFLGTFLDRKREKEKKNRPADLAGPEASPRPGASGGLSAHTHADRPAQTGMRPAG